MAEIQAYIAAFTFGLLVQGSIAAVFSYFQGHGSTVRKDSRRLVLILFLIFTALWAQINLVNFMIPFPNVTACQATVIASTFFDQTARVIIGGFLLWSIGHVSKSPVETYGLGALMGMRIVAAAVFVGFTRPQFGPLCVARSIVLPPPIAVLAMDIIIIGVLIIRVCTLGFLEAIRDGQPSKKKEQSRAFVYCTAGLLIWTLTSGAMLVGIPPITLLLRTGLPAAGLIALISIISFFSGALVLPRDEDAGTPESQSPFVAPTSRSLNAFSGESGSPNNTSYMRSANLFVVNPSLTPGGSPSVNMPENVEAGDGTFTICPAELDSVDTSKSRESTKVRNSSSRRRSGLGTSTWTSGPTGRLAQMGDAALITSGKTIVDDQVQDTSYRASLVSGKERKRSIFGRSKQPIEVSVRQQGISKPVMIDSESSVAPPFARVRTVDLATAAANERARREDNVVRSLIPMRPAPPPPTRPTSKIRRKTINERRSETPGRVPVPIITLNSGKSSFDSSRLSVKANASSTSSSLSPGGEDVRRRSPSAMKRVDVDDERVGLPGLPPKNTVTRISENPLRQSVTAGGEYQRVVMYVNNIVPDHPGIVNSIISGPPSILNKSKPLPELANSPKSPKSSTSILHRPRPYRRKSEKDASSTANQRSPSHVRQKLTSAIVPITTEKAALSKEGPTVPPLALPTTASRLERLLPNDTRSMTAEEKISLLFPAPPGVHGVPNRRSSVPSVPRIPSSILQMDPFDQMLTENRLQERRNSKRRTISFGGPSLGESVTPVVETLKLNEHGLGLFVSQSIEDSSGHASHARESRKSISSNSSSETDEFNDDSKSAWASIHSPTPAIDVTMVQKAARETYIQMRKQALLHVVLPEQQPIVTLDMEHETKGSGSEDGAMTVMLGLDVVSGSAGSSQIVPADTNTGNLPRDVARPMLENKWHRRIGDELPTFSQRRNYPRSRTASPPTPLRLYNGRRATVVECKPVTVTAMESPREALMKIQSQLNNFEWPSTEAPASDLNNQPQLRSNLAASTNDSRLGLLADLEKEMNQQESHWMQMQHNFDRDSNSVIMTPRAPPSPPSDDFSEEISRNGQQRPRNGNNNNPKSNSDNSSPPWTRKLQSPRSNMWQQRLAEAQLEYMENVPALKGMLNINLLSVSKTPQLGSPTPPDSLDSASDLETDTDYPMATEDNEVKIHQDIRLPVAMSKLVALWRPTESAPKSMAGHLWTPPICSNVRVFSPEPAAKSTRPAERRYQHSLSSLPITSTSMWSKPTVKEIKARDGLWCSAKARPKSIIIRPKTQKPQRKSKRVTFLPDILESPSPLPHKRDTLGIFQFPWGEKSDSAVYEPLPIPNQAIRSIFAVNSTLTVPSQLVDQELVEYSSSFFDDYDEEYDLDSINNSDDEFDETTLWDIASLLNSTNIPSKNSLLPPPTIIEDYDDTDDSDQELIEVNAMSSPQMQPPAQPSMVQLPIQPLKPQVISRNWDDGDLASMSPRAFSKSSDVWQAFLPSLDDAVRAASNESAMNAPALNFEKRRLLDKALPSLPMEETLATRSQTNSYGDNKPSGTTAEGLSTVSDSHMGLWTAQEARPINNSVSLWNAQPSLMTKYPSFQSDSSIWMPIRKATTAFDGGADILPKLTSTSLWVLSESQLPMGKHWLHATALREPRNSQVAWQGSKSLPVKTTSTSNTIGEMKPRQRASVATLPPLQPRGSIWTSPLARSNTVPGRKLQTGDSNISFHKPLPLARVLAESAEEGRAAVKGQNDRDGETTKLWRPKWGLPGSPREGLKTREGKTKAATDIGQEAASAIQTGVWDGNTDSSRPVAEKRTEFS